MPLEKIALFKKFLLGSRLFLYRDLFLEHRMGTEKYMYMDEEYEYTVSADKR